MRLPRHSSPKVNTGSMADIAFLLLIFFLVTTTISVDQGISRKLPRLCPPNSDCSETINERNIFRIVLNANDELFVEDRLIQFEELKDLTKEFLDNNGEGACDYCKGKKLLNLSDHPKQAVISLQNDKLTSYSFYIKVQDELTKAYYELRANYAFNILGKKVEVLNSAELDKLKAVYPFILSEADTK